MREHSVYLRYGCAVASVLVATVVTRLLGALDPDIGVLFFAAVMFSAWYGGLGPGLVATVLSATGSALVFEEPPWSMAIGLDDWLRLLVFTGEAVLISYLANAARNATLRAEQAYARAKAANQAKDRFLSVLSHELRMPLNPVLTAASAMARDAALPPQVREDMRMIQRNVELEARLIDDLLDLSRLSKDKLHLEPRPTDTRPLVEQVRQICRGEMERKGLGFRLEDRASATWVHGDPARLQQILWNLVRNAAKFTPAGGTVGVRLWNEPAGAAPQWLLIEVSDTGIGIDPAALDRIFNAFEQADAAITRQYGGLGLGLAICRGLVALHGGVIRARSDGPGKGATFAVSLPVTEPGLAAVEQSTPALAPEQSLRILLVEDQPDTLRLMARLLRSANHTVDTADSMDAAIAAAACNDYDLLISDLGLPDGSGLDLMQQLRRQHNLKGIALTGYGSEDDVRRTREAGFSRHLTKPVDVSKLEEAIRETAR